jgi:hypothetical protein
VGDELDEEAEESWDDWERREGGRGLLRIRRRRG